MEKYTQKYMLTYYSQNNTVAIANKTKTENKQTKENNTRETQKNTHRETRKGSRAVKYFHQPRLSGEEDSEPKGQHSLSRGGSKDVGRDA